MRGRRASSILRALDRLGSCRTDDAFEASLTVALETFGCEWFVHTVLPNTHLRLEEAVGASRLPKGFYETYRDGDLAKSDPVVCHCRLSSDPVDWARFGTKRCAVMGRARDHGMRSGFTVPIHAARGYAACFSVSGMDEIDARTKPAIQLIAMYAGERARASRSKRPMRPGPLSPREAEVLTWAAIGKSNADTAEILNISVRTVTAHMVNAMDKLGAANKTQAVVNAMQNGFIAP